MQGLCGEVQFVVRVQSHDRRMSAEAAGTFIFWDTGQQTTSVIKLRRFVGRVDRERQRESAQYGQGRPWRCFVLSRSGWLMLYAAT